MYPKIFAWLIICLCLSNAWGQSPEVEEAARLSAQVVRLYQQKRYAEALPLAEKALALREKNLGAEHLLVAEAAYNLGSLKFQLEDLGQAQTLLERARQIYEKSPSASPKELAATLFLSGGIYYAQGAFDKAVLSLQQALTLRERWLGPAHSATLDTVLMLANAYQQDQKFDSAEFLYRSYVTAQEKQNPPDAGLAGALERLSCILWKKGEEKEALATEQRSDNLRGLTGPVLKVSSKALKANQTTRPPLNVALDRAKYAEMLPGSYSFVGEIEIRILVNEKGEVARACALAGPLPALGFYESAMRRARFTPFTQDSQIVKAVGEIKYLYEIAPLRRPGP